MGQIFVRCVLPAGCPDQVEALRQPEQATAASRRYIVQDAVDPMEAPGLRVVWVEPEQAYHSINVYKKKRIAVTRSGPAGISSIAFTFARQVGRFPGHPSSIGSGPVKGEGKPTES